MLLSKFYKLVEIFWPTKKQIPSHLELKIQPQLIVPSLYFKPASMVRFSNLPTQGYAGVVFPSTIYAEFSISTSF